MHLWRKTSMSNTLFSIQVLGQPAFLEQCPTWCARSISWVSRIALYNGYLWRYNSLENTRVREPIDWCKQSDELPWQTKRNTFSNLYVNLPIASNNRSRRCQCALNTETIRRYGCRRRYGWWRGTSPNDLWWTRGYRDRGGRLTLSRGGSLGRCRGCNCRLRGCSLGWGWLWLCWCIRPLRWGRGCRCLLYSHSLGWRSCCGSNVCLVYFVFDVFIHHHYAIDERFEFVWFTLGKEKAKIPLVVRK